MKQIKVLYHFILIEPLLTPSFNCLFTCIFNKFTRFNNYFFLPFFLSFFCVLFSLDLSFYSWIYNERYKPFGSIDEWVFQSGLKHWIEDGIKPSICQYRSSRKSLCLPKSISLFPFYILIEVLWPDRVHSKTIVTSS